MCPQIGQINVLDFYTKNVIDIFLLPLSYIDISIFADIGCVRSRNSSTHLYELILECKVKFIMEYIVYLSFLFQVKELLCRTIKQGSMIEDT